MLDSFTIDEAAKLELKDYGCTFEETRDGAEVINAARQMLALEEDQSAKHAAIPFHQSIGRKEEMSATGCLTLFRQEDGDIILTAMDGEGNSATVEFCSLYMGGGKSPRTREALLDLMLAIIEDKRQRPKPGYCPVRAANN